MWIIYAPKYKMEKGIFAVLNMRACLRGIVCLLLTVMMAATVLATPADVFEAKNTEMVFYAYGDIDKPETRINAIKISGVDTIVLPSSASREKIVLYCNVPEAMHVSGAKGTTVFVSGKELELEQLCYDEEYVLQFSQEGYRGSSKQKLQILFSENIPAIYLSSADASKGRLWVESSADKSNKAKGSMVMQNASGEVVHAGALSQIKGRGNTTWGLEKKPYQIKLEEKTDLLQTGDAANASKTWILLANYLDPVGIRNALALGIGSALDMPANIQGKSVDLYYDGEYRGMYMLTEKVEIGSGRVEIANLEEENEKVNADVDLESLSVLTATTENGATYTYCEGMHSPEDISGGYLLEMDYEERALEEICYFRTKRGMYIVVKSPEYASKEEMDYIASMYQEYEDAVFEGGVHPETGKKYTDYIDARSVACYYLVNEFSKARDCFQSSAYLHKNAGEDKFYMGPLWDYDMSFGKGDIDYYGDDTPYGISALGIEMCEALFEIDEFYQHTKEIYQNEFLPLVNTVLLGDEDAESDEGNLKSLDYYQVLVEASGNCNAALWYSGTDWAQESGKLYDFINIRKTALNEYFNNLPNVLEIPEKAYYDVFPEEWHYESIYKASEKALLRGMGKGLFRPEKNVLRSHAVQAAYNMSDVTNVQYIPMFSDVAADAWYADAVVWAGINDLVDGSADGTFQPDKEIVREEFIDILYRFSGSPKVETELVSDYTDVGMVTKRAAVEWALSTGVLLGYDAQLHPQDVMTRAEFATILVRYDEWRAKE